MSGTRTVARVVLESERCAEQRAIIGKEHEQRRASAMAQADTLYERAQAVAEQAVASAHAATEAAQAAASRVVIESMALAESFRSAAATTGVSVEMTQEVVAVAEIESQLAAAPSPRAAEEVAKTLVAKVDEAENRLLEARVQLAGRIEAASALVAGLPAGFAAKSDITASKDGAVHITVGDPTLMLLVEYTADESGEEVELIQPIGGECTEWIGEDGSLVAERGGVLKVIDQIHENMRPNGVSVNRERDKNEHPPPAAGRASTPSARRERRSGS